MNTFAARGALFNFDRLAVINLHCIPTAFVEMQPKFIKRPP